MKTQNINIFTVPMATLSFVVAVMALPSSNFAFADEPGGFTDYAPMSGGFTDYASSGGYTDYAPASTGYTDYAQVQTSGGYTDYAQAKTSGGYTDYAPVTSADPGTATIGSVDPGTATIGSVPTAYDVYNIYGVGGYPYYGGFGGYNSAFNFGLFYSNVGTPTVVNPIVYSTPIVNPTPIVYNTPVITQPSVTYVTPVAQSVPTYNVQAYVPPTYYTQPTYYNYTTPTQYNYTAPIPVYNNYNAPTPPAPPAQTPTTPYVALTQIPYTGIDFGPVGDAMYWLALILFAVAGAYLVVYYIPGHRIGITGLTNEVFGEPEMLAAVSTGNQTRAEAAAKGAEPSAVGNSYGAFGTSDAMTVERSKKGEAPRIVIVRN